MFFIESYAMAVVFSIITMICWGSWPNTQKLTSRGWRFETFYWDYVFGVFLCTILFACTLGNIGCKGRGFFDDIAQAHWHSILLSTLSGAIFNAGNILFVAAISIAGMSVAFPVGGGLALVLGVIVNYFSFPLGNPLFLFGGVLLILLAMLFSGTSYRLYSAMSNRVSAKGLITAISAGVLFGFFFRFLAGALATDIVEPEGGKLTPYTAVFFFAAGALASNFLFNSIIMRRPITGVPVSYRDYFRGSARDHFMGISGGVIWGVGLVLSLLSVDRAGFAISFGLGQGNALVAAIWGVFIWKEFKGASRISKHFLALMFICYVAGLLLIILSR